MTTKEAIQAMLDGKKVRYVHEEITNYFIYFDGTHFKNGDDNSLYDLHNMVSGSMYEIYEEPKPKETVTIEKWLLKGKSLCDSGYFHIVETSDIDVYISAWDDSYIKVKLLYTYEVEL